MSRTSKTNLSNHLLSDPNVGSLLFKLSLPAFIGMAVQALYNIVDAIFVGRGVGSEAISAITVAMPVQMTILAIGTTVGMGSASIISRALGAHDIHRAERALGNALWTVLVLGFAFAVTGKLLVRPILLMFGATPDILGLAIEYTSIILYGNIFFAFSLTTNNIIRSEGRARFAMVSMLISGGLNIILDPIFIFWFGMGVGGAALATVISQAASAIWVLSFFLRGKSVLRIHARDIRYYGDMMKETLLIGSAALARQMSGIVLAIIINNKLKILGGSMAIGAFGLMNRIMMFVLMPVFGISQGLQPVAGFNYGAKRYGLTIRAAKLGILAATALTTLGFIVIELLAPLLIRIFTTDPELIHLGSRAMRIGGAMLFIVGYQITGASVFQAIGKPTPSLILTLSRQVLFLIPLLFILTAFFDLTGVWLAFPVSDLLSAVVTSFLFARELKILQNMGKETA